MMDSFAGHNLHLETARLRLRPFEDSDFDVAAPFYRDPDFLNAMEEAPPGEPVTADYLRRAGKAMAEQGFLCAIMSGCRKESADQPWFGTRGAVASWPGSHGIEWRRSHHRHRIPLGATRPTE